MNEILFYKSNPNSAIITPTDIFEVEIGGVLIKLRKRYKIF
jgi:hypothetical protein